MFIFLIEELVTMTLPRLFVVSLAPSHPLLATGKVTQVGPFCSPLLDKMVTCKGLLPHKSNMEPEIHPIDRRKKSPSKLPFWDSMLVVQGIIQHNLPCDGGRRCGVKASEWKLYRVCRCMCFFIMERSSTAQDDFKHVFWST